MRTGAVELSSPADRRGQLSACHAWSPHCDALKERYLTFQLTTASDPPPARFVQDVAIYVRQAHPLPTVASVRRQQQRPTAEVRRAASQTNVHAERLQCRAQVKFVAGAIE